MDEGVGTAYDARAEEYVALFGGLAQRAPEDRALLERWRDATPGPLLDAGCGPGPWSGFLADGGRRVVGVDLSARFLTHARATQPRATFVRGSLTALPLRDRAVGGVLAWFSTIHTAPAELPGLLAELARVVAPGGSLLLGFVDGTPAEPYAHAVTTAYTWSHAALRPLLATAGFVVTEEHARHDEGARPQGSLVARREARPTQTPRT